MVNLFELHVVIIYDLISHLCSLKWLCVCLHFPDQILASFSEILLRVYPSFLLWLCILKESEGHTGECTGSRFSFQYEHLYNLSQVIWKLPLIPFISFSVETRFKRCTFVGWNSFETKDN